MLVSITGRDRRISASESEHVERTWCNVLGADAIGAKARYQNLKPHPHQVGLCPILGTLADLPTKKMPLTMQAIHAGQDFLSHPLRDHDIRSDSEDDIDFKCTHLLSWVISRLQCAPPPAWKFVAPLLGLEVTIDN